MIRMNTWTCLLLIFGVTLGKETGLGSTSGQISTTVPPPVTSGKTDSTIQTSTTVPTTENKQTTRVPTTHNKQTTTVAPSSTESLNNYNVTTDEGKKKKKEVCLLATFKGHFKGKKTWNITADAKVQKDESNCSKLAVEFGENNFVLSFHQTDKKHFYIETITANLSGTEHSKSGLNIAQAANGSSYMCKSGVTVDMENSMTFVMTDLQVQAYWVGKEGNYATATDCNSDLSPIVPIIVGAILAGLVIIVVVAYFIGRNRNRVGYEEI